MATAPYFVISPNTLMSLVGLVHGPDPTEPTPPEDWRQAVVDVVIPAKDEALNIVYCLSSVHRQTLQPRQVILVDDGGTDATAEEATRYCEQVGLPLVVFRRAESIGKTPTIKRQAREFDADVEFILDGDTFLESEDYIARTVEELYKGVGIASACGTVLPIRNRDRRAFLSRPDVQLFRATTPEADLVDRRSWLHRLWWGITNTYREILYLFLQRFLYRGQMVFFGGITNPVGCAVAYRRQYIEDLFDTYEPIFGDDLTNSEDIFIGFALMTEGYRNVHLRDVVARSEEPEVQRLPRQIYMWSSSFLQSCYYFDVLLRSPFKAPKRAWQRLRARLSGEAERIAEKRRIKEAYRQAFGVAYTRRWGRPIGWIVLTSAVEKVFFPFVLLLMLVKGWWFSLGLTLAAETLLALVILAVSVRERRALTVFKGFAITPLRYLSLVFDLVTIGVFSSHLWLTRSRKWRK